MPKISIIMPTYNREKIIKNAIESVLSQTEKDLELIVVDDGSTDNTSKVIESFKDSRIKYFKRTNHGIGASRNFGLDKATGDYISFLDSDDSLKKDFVEKMIKEAKKRKLDIAVCNYEGIYQDGKTKIVSVEPFSDTTLENNPDLLNILYLAPWGKIYSKKIFSNNHIRFPEKIKYEDVNFVVKSLKEAKKIGLVNEILVNYTVDNISETLVVNEKVFDIFKVINTLRKDLNSLGFKKARERFIVSTLCNYNIQQRRQKSRELRHKFINESFNYMKYNVDNYKNNSYYNERSLLKKLIEKNRLLSIVYCDLYAFLHSFK